MFTTNPYEVFNFAEFWDTLSTSFVQFEFIFFVFALTALYYLFPKQYRWTVLLGGSVVFYSIAGVEALITILLTAFVVYLSALFIESTDRKDKKKRRLFLGIGVIVLLTVLIFVKLYSFLDWDFHYVVPLGISYYTFSSIGYLADVYWGKDRAQRNYFKLALFLLYFPKILQGPISKHKTLAPQLVEGHAFDYEQFCFGIQLAIWGYFKKMVIADRLAMFTTTVFGNHSNFGGAMLALAAVLSGFQLYCDFSGCMDIARGISQMLGIKLDKNFDLPFFASHNASEFWRRWHITLGTWFKDYVYMPIVISPRMIKLSGAVSKLWGKRAGKAVMTIIPTIVVWILTGLWHGTGINYVLWGLYWGFIIILSTVFTPEIKLLTKKLHIDTTTESWKKFQVLRTFALFCVSRVITSCHSASAIAEVLGTIFTRPMLWQLFDGTLFAQGLNELEFFLAALGIALLIYVSVLQLKGSVRERIAKWNMVSRCAVFVLLVMLILIFGIYGPDFGATTFVYANY